MSEEVPLPPPRRRWVRRFAGLGIGLLVLGGIVAGLVALQNVRGRQRLTDALVQLEAQKVELDWRKLRPPREASEGAKLLLQARHGGDRRKLPNPALMIGPGIFRSALSLTNWEYRDFQQDPPRTSLVDWDHVSRLLETNRTLIDLYHKALVHEAPWFEMGYDSWPYAQMSHLSPAADASAWLQGDVLLSTRDGKFLRAHESLLSRLHLAIGLSRDYSALSLIIGAAVQAGAGEVMSAVYYNVEWTDSQWAQLQAGFAAVDWMDAVRKTHALETAAGWHFLQQVQTNLAAGKDMILWQSPEWYDAGRSKALGWLEDSTPMLHNWVDGGLGHVENWWQEEAFPRLWHMAWRDADAAVYIERQAAWHERLKQVTSDAAMTTLVREAEWKEIVPWEHEPKNYTEDMALQLSGRLAGITTAKESLERMLVAQHRARIATTAIAIRRHELAEGRAPNQLEDLVPRFLTTVPLDPGDGQPLRYRRNADDTWQLYSTGRDGVDDRGDGNPSKATSRRYDAVAARDILWPRPATPEEMSAFEKAFAGRRVTGSPDGDAGE